MRGFRDQVRDRAQVLGEAGEPNQRNAGISVAESVLALLAAIGTGLIAREVVEASWRNALDRDPPKNPASPEVDWKEALLWGTFSGALVGMARIASRRWSTRAYRHFRSRN